MDKDLISSLWALLEPILEPEGIEMVDLEFKFETGRWVLRLYIDKPGGVNLNDCELVSRQAGALLDMEDPIRQAYHLEVSSPGINRVLRKEKDFVLYAGAPVRIKTSKKLNGSRNFRGTLQGVENSRIILDINGKRVEIAPEDLEKARLDLPESELFRRDPKNEQSGRGIDNGK